MVSATLRKSRELLLLCFALLCCANLASAQSPGSADPSWPTPSHAYAPAGLQGWHQIIAQPSGKLLVTGNVPNGGDPYPAIWRYRADGQLDSSFGEGGERRIDIGSLSVDSTGRIYSKTQVITQSVVDGRTRNDFSIQITRLLVDGAHDTSFGTGGVVTILVQASYVQGDAQSDETAFEQQYSASPNFHQGALLLQPDGKLLFLAMGREKNRPAAELVLIGMRLLPNGQLDTGFGPNGFRTLARFADGATVAGPQMSQVDVWSNGAFAVAINQPNLPRAAHILKFTADGTADAGFGANGSVYVPGAFVDTIRVQTDGKLVVGGALGGAPPNDQPVVARLQANGSLDRDFGTNGSTAFAEPIASVALERGGGIIVGTSARSTADPSPLELFRLTPEGDLDSSFVSTEIPQDLDGEIVIAQGIYLLTAEQDFQEFTAEAIRKFILQPEPRSGSLSTGQTPSDSGFRIDARSLNGNLVASAPTTHVLGLHGYIFPQGADIGASADLFVVAASPRGMYMRDSAGRFVPWSGSVADLVPAYEDVQLTNTTHVLVYAGQLPFTGTYRLYVGYMRSAGGPLIYIDVPGTLDITQ